MMFDWVNDCREGRRSRMSGGGGGDGECGMKGRRNGEGDGDSKVW